MTMHLRLLRLAFLLLTSFLVHLNADEQHSYQPFHVPNTTLSTTIPAFLEKSDVVGSCPLDLPDALFTSISHSCSSSTPSRYRCCPTLAAWLYSAYSSSALSLHLPPSADLPVLPDDSESCLGGVDKALSARGVALGKVNESCDVVGCYCGVRLRPLSCPGGLSVAKEEGRWVAKDDMARKVARDCTGTGVSGCNRCLRSLYQVKEAAAVGGKATTPAGTGGGTRRKKTSRRKHDRDCQLMGLTWLLAKNRTLYLPTATMILRAFMMSPVGQDPLTCTLGRDGLPLAVDSSAFNDDISSSPSATTFGSSLSTRCLRWISRVVVLALVSAGLVLVV